MAQVADTQQGEKALKLATFYVGEALCGVDILKVQEINKNVKMTKVPQAPEYVLGVLNLRGKIVTVIDLGRKLGLTPAQHLDDTRNIIVNSKDEHIGLFVDRIGDVAMANREDVESPPANIGSVQGKYFAGVYKTEKNLIGILDLDEVLKDEGH